MTAMRLAADSATFRDVQMRALRRSHGEQWVKAMLTAPRGKGGSAWAPGTIRTRFNNARTVLRAAVGYHIIAADPFEGIALPRVRRPEMAITLPAMGK